MAECGDAQTEEDGEFRARSYQLELFEKACETNTIVCLKTGAGKTFIAVMLVKELQHEIAKPFAEGKRTFFMVPKVPLVEQQAKVIEAHTALKVGKYYGEMGVDFWNDAKWRAELEKHHVIVMTAQILVNLLGAGIMSMNKINLLVFDECHAANGNHPYCAIMERYKDFEEKPRILGLTAAIVNGKCPPSRVDLQMRKLETALHCRIQTSRDLLSVARFSTKPREVLVECSNRGEFTTAEEAVFERLNFAMSEIKPLLVRVKDEKSWFTARVFSGADPIDVYVNDDIYVCGEATKVLPSPHVLVKNVRTILATMGLWCTSFLVRYFLDELPHWRAIAKEQLKTDCVQIYNILENTFLKVDTLVRNALQAVPVNSAVIEFTTPKLRRLLELLTNLNPDCGSYKAASFLESFRCIVFVECRITASVLSKYLLKVASIQPEKFRFLKPCFLVGHGCRLPFLKHASMKVDKQNEILESFRLGNTNLMVATTVVEEGLDIPRCNVVVRFDPPKNFCSYVQSMGRARAESALYVLLVEVQDRSILENELATYKVIEDILQTRSNSRSVPTAEETAEHYIRRQLVPPYYPKSKDGACVTMGSSLNTLNMYTSHLKGDRYTIVKPDFTYATSVEDGTVKCTITMPTGSLLRQPITGESMPSLKEAKQAAGLKVCILLHKAGELDDRLLPCIPYLERYLTELGIVANEEVLPGAPIPGTKRRRLIYDRIVADDLSDCYPKAEGLVYLHSIRVIADNNGENKSCFGILSSKPISRVCPFTIFTKLKYTIVVEPSRRPFLLKKTEIETAKSFHEVLFGDILHLVAASMSFVPKDAGLSFLIVPVVGTNSEDFDIDWQAVLRCVHYKGWQHVANVKHKRVHVPERGSVVEPIYGDASIRSKRFFVREVMRNLSPMSEFDQIGNDTYSNYFERKYGAIITDFDQPLILVDFAPNSISLLTPSKATGNPRKVREMHLVPELCQKVPLDQDQFQQALFLPSIIHRLNGMLVAKALGDQILNEAVIVCELNSNDGYQRMLEDVYKTKTCKLDDATIFEWKKEGTQKLEASTLYALVYQALTCRSAANWDDLERLELIGDSYLKYIVSVYLYCEYSHLNEGCLSILRTGLVKNATLCHFAKLKKIPEVMNTSMFQPRINWLPPGYVIPEELSEKLSEARVPAHLWPFAMLEDVTLYRFFLNRNGWIDELTHRWDETDPGIKEAVQVAILEPRSAHDDLDSKDQTADIAYNHFTQQLIGDKNVADSTEALIGVVLLSCGQDAVLRLLEWFEFRLERRSVTAVDDHDSFPWRRPTTALVKPIFFEMGEEIYSMLYVLEDKLGYRFRDKSFLRQAVVHSSYMKHPATDNYQRLEFLGDAILDFLITMNLYKKYPNMSPGDMTDLRSSLVDNTTFAFLTVKFEIHKHMRYNSLTLPQAIDNYLQHHSKLSHPKEAIYMYGEDEVLDLSDVEVPKALGDLFESVAGAVFVDSGFSLETVWRVFQPILKDLMDDYSKCLPINPIRKLLEHIPSSKFGRATRFEDSKTFTVRVTCGAKIFVGRGRTKAVAKQAAAKCALRALKLLSVRNLNLNA